MSRHNDDGPPGGPSDQHPQDPTGPDADPGRPRWPASNGSPVGETLPSWVVQPTGDRTPADPAPGQPDPTDAAASAEPPAPSDPVPGSPQGSHWHLPPGVAGPDHDHGPLGHVPPDVPMPGPAIPDQPDRPRPDLSAPPAQGPTPHRPDLGGPATEHNGDLGAQQRTDPVSETNPSRLRGFRRRQLPPPEPHRQLPALPAAGVGPGADPSESRSIVPGQTATPGQLGSGIRGQLGPGPISHGERVPSPQRSAPIPRAESDHEPGHPGMGSTGPPREPVPPTPANFPVPPELPTPPVRRPGTGEPRTGGSGAGGPGSGGLGGPGRAGATEPPDRPTPPARSGGEGPAAAAANPGGPGTRTASGAPRPGLMASQPRRLSPEQIRTSTFGRSPLGRRGYNEDEVNQFTNRLAEELAARDAEVVRLIDENHRLKQAMRDWQSERIDQPEVDVAERVNAETAAMVAKAQQHIDAQLAQTELYCRQREQEAVRRYDEVVRHARQQVKQEAEQVAQRYRATSGAGYNPDQETLQRQQVYIGALLQALDALGAHVQATRQAFATEIGKLTTPVPPAPADNPPQRVD